MNNFLIFDASISDDNEQWIELLNEWPLREVFAHPSYLRLFARECDKCICAVMKNSDGVIMFPMILRPLSAESWFSGDFELFDLTTPYGYGGPFFWGNVSSDYFWFRLEEWANLNKIVTLYARLFLFDDYLIRFHGSVEIVSANIVRDLTNDLTDIWMQYAHKVRKNINKANRSGLRVCIDYSGEKISEFLEIYYSTMDRREALNSYYYPKTFFESIIADLPGQFIFFHVYDDDKMISTELVLISSQYVYSFLGGTVQDFFELRPNELLKHAVIQWAKERGKKAYILGGGTMENDGIYKYKKAFSPNGDIPFMIGKIVFSSSYYDLLISMKQKYLAGDKSDPIIMLDRFPQYRYMKV